MSGIVAVNLESLIPGRTLEFPVYDMHGVLLLSEGNLLTMDLKRKLALRGISKVLLNEADVAKATLQGQTTISEKAYHKLEQKLDTKLDSLIRSGMLQVRNTGPALKESVVQHGCKNYDPDHQAAVRAQQVQHAAEVEHVFGEIEGGGEVDGRQMNRVADGCVEKLVEDLAATLHCILVLKEETTLAQHSTAVAALAMSLGIEIGLDEENVRTVGVAGLLQDVGMLRVPRELRELDRPLTRLEFLEIQKHAVHTSNYLQNVKGIASVVQLAAYQVHERPDGSGYPRGRTMKSIHMFARILAVADAYVAMTSPRPYRPPLMPYSAVECLIKEANRRLVDPAVVRGLLGVMSLFPIGSFVMLSDRSVGQVLRANPKNYAAPIVLRLQDAQGAACDPEDDDSLVDLAATDLSVVQALPTPDSHEVGLHDDYLNHTTIRM